MVDVTQYTDLITSEHADKPNYMTMVALTTQPFADSQNGIALFTEDYDLDNAVGNQLDVCGQWIGASRIIKIPIDGNYFELDVVGSGLDEKPWYVIGQALFTSVALSDDDYRQFLKAKAAANIWDGTINGAYAVYDILFNGKPTAIKIHDYQNMFFALEIVGVVPNAATMAILNQDYLGLRPMGVNQLPTILP